MFLAWPRVLFVPQKDSRKMASAALKDEEAGAVHAVRFLSEQLHGDPLELVGIGFVIDDHGVHVGHVAGLWTESKRKDVDASWHCPVVVGCKCRKPRPGYE